MKTYIALLRAINVGGTGKLAMERLRQLCHEAGFEAVRSYIQSGNLVLQSPRSETEVRHQLQQILQQELGKPYDVFVRSPGQLARVLEDNRFPQADPKLLQIVFLAEPPDPQMLETVVAPDGEELALGSREVYVHYPGGLGTSRLKAPGLKAGTSRNLNTVRKLLLLAGGNQD